MNAGQMLQVGILVDSAIVPAWQAHMLRAIDASDCAQIAGIVVSNARNRSRSAGMLHKAVTWLEDSNRRRKPDALQPEAVGSLGHAAPWTEVLDVVVALADPANLPAGLPGSRFGTWYFEHLDRPLMPPDGSMIGLSEVVDRVPTLETGLRIRRSAGELERVAFETRSAVDSFSHYATRNQHLWKCSTFVLRTLRRCHALGAAAYLDSLPAAAPRPHRAAAATCSPGSRPAVSVASVASYVQWRLRQRRLRRQFRERWILLGGSRTGHPDPARLAPMLPPAGRFWADPHVVQESGATHVFFEDAHSGTGKGHIAAMTMRANGRFAEPVSVLQRPYHLSYPFVFEWEGCWFMIPESADNQTVELYRCTRMPHEWTFEHDLLSGIKAYDATLVQHEGRWWMFAAVSENAGSSAWDELCIYHADSPISRDWRPHPANPVVSDVCSARPAGPFFRQEGRLFRPSQDSSGRYGRALNVNEVLQLDERGFRETLVEKVEPVWSPTMTGTHTYSFAGNTAFMDAIHREPR